MPVHTAAQPKVKPPITKVQMRDLLKWVERKLNILLIGRHGCGKTTMIKECWEQHLGWVEGIDYKYLSASTLDPWVDLVGIPTADGEITNVTQEQIAKVLAIIEAKDSGELTTRKITDILTTPDTPRNISFIQPKWLFTVKAVLVDELNRSHPKVRNALMEFIQFRSVNGRSLDNLRLVWGAINPENDETFEYDVERLDPATKDRFHLHIYVPYEPSFDWFAREFDDVDLSAGVCQWWNRQSEEVKDAISPRRLEYCVRHVRDDSGDIRHVIPDAIALGAKYSELVQIIRTSSPILREMREIYDAKNKEKATEFIADETNYDHCIDEILKMGYYRNFFVPLMPNEKIATLFSNTPKIRTFILENFSKYAIFEDILKDIHDTTGDSTLRSQISRLFSDASGKKDSKVGKSGFGALVRNPNADVPFTGTGNDVKLLEEQLLKTQGYQMEHTYQRQKAFDSLKPFVPSHNIKAPVACLLLKVLDLQICGRSHVNRLARQDRQGGEYEGLIAIINRAVDSLNNLGEDLSNFGKDYPKLFEIVMLMRHRFLFKI